MIKVPNEVAQAIINYLITRPWTEVDALIAALRGCEPVEEKEE